MATPKPEQPILWIVAGPNGSGKSTLYDQSAIENFGRSVWIINPDVLTIRIHETEGHGLEAANLEAVRRIETWLEASINAHRTIGVETVLSTDKYRRLVVRAKALQFEVRLIYVILNSVELQLQRIRDRVATGGHDVPADKVLARRHRSLEQLPWFLDQADEAWIYDNSRASLRLVGEKRGGIITLEPSAPPELRRAVEMMDQLEPR